MMTLNLLVLGTIVFALVLMGVLLTVLEFRSMK